VTALDIQLSAWPFAAPEDEAVLEADPVLDEPEEVPVELPEEELLEAELEPLEVAVADPELAVAPRLKEVGEEAALHVPAVFAAQQASLPFESWPQ